ncbi:hypothetical protein H2203_006857 [Taxawa tesnikishii (nom. ined.)]|nr:hypothetical protein H2203_006857 [Dothideales sp. JES 119]
MQPAVRDSLSSTVNVNNHSETSQDLASDETRHVRSIPPWIHSADDEDEAEQTARLLRPSSTVTASHHYLPAPPQHNRPPGRKWDHARSAEPALLDHTLSASAERWKPYMMSGPQPGGFEGARLVSDEWMDENMPDLSQPWHTQDPEEMSEKVKGFWLFSKTGRKRAFGKAQRILLKNPFIPLVFRLIVLTFTLAALGLAGRVYHQSHAVQRTSPDGCVQRASTYMALAVDSVAVPYIVYITWDEYFSKPLGLRSAAAKLALIFIDLYFIVFEASNLSLAFDALKDFRWACYDEAPARSTCPNSPNICHSQTGLTGVLVIALIAWLATFSISVLRVVERLK